ncbi:hypothetical protein D9M68_916130 [compost metagenome]
MQAMGIGQGNAQRGPVLGHLAAQGFEHAAAGRGLAEGFAAPLDQQVTEALEQLAVGLAEAGQAKQPAKRLTAML